MFEYDTYMELKITVYKLRKAGEWDSLSLEIQRFYKNQIKYWQRRLGLPNDENSADSTQHTENRKKPDRKKYYDHPLSLERAEDELGFMPISPFSVEDEAIRREVYQALYAEINNLEEEQKRIIAIYYFEGKSEEKTAAELGITKSKVNYQKHKAIELLEKALINFR